MIMIVTGCIFAQLWMLFMDRKFTQLCGDLNIEASSEGCTHSVAWYTCKQQTADRPSQTRLAGGAFSS